ncbi:hypothetical protein [Arenimonas aestuarii]
MDEYKGVMFGAAVIAYSIWLFRAQWLSDEIKRNAFNEAPSEDQVRWHIRHMRQDLHALVMINHALLILLAWVAVFRL